MTHPLKSFAIEAQRLLDLVDPDGVPDSQLEAFAENRRRLDFMIDLLGRARMLEHCRKSLLALTERYRERLGRVRSLTTIPQELVDEDEEDLGAVDASTSLIYYEVVSMRGMLEQLRVTIDGASEVCFLTKIRDRFFAHVRLAEVQRGRHRGWTLPAAGFLAPDIIRLNSWSAEDLRVLSVRSLVVGSTEWEAQRRANERLVLSGRHNEKFTSQDVHALRSVGVRECNLELALQEIGDILVREVIPLIQAEAARAVAEFGYRRWEVGLVAEPPD